MFTFSINNTVKMWLWSSLCVFLLSQLIYHFATSRICLVNLWRGPTPSLGNTLDSYFLYFQMSSRVAKSMCIIIYVTSVIYEDTSSSIETLSRLRLRRQSGGWADQTHHFPFENQECESWLLHIWKWHMVGAHFPVFAHRFWTSGSVIGFICQVSSDTMKADMH